MPAEIRVDSSFWLGMALLLLTLPFPWVVSAILAAGFHELCHLAVLMSFSVKVHTLTLRFGGAQLQTAPMTLKEELLCALAGPAGSFLLLILLRIFPRLALCALAQGIYNLLPTGNLDGSRTVKCAIRLLSAKRPCKQ